jgi:hypothetical protein
MTATTVPEPKPATLTAQADQLARQLRPAFDSASPLTRHDYRMAALQAVLAGAAPQA